MVMAVNIILGYIVPFILFVVGFYFIKTCRNEEVVRWVKIAVKAAEQIYKESGQGEEKFAYVYEWISNKFRISEEELRNIIESTVYELNNIGTKE